MPKKPPAPLTAADLADFIAADSDFALEMSTLSVLRSVGLEAEHSAAYVDPVTGKIRAYDIRARLITADRSVRLAVECKNLQPSAPLLIHATPRLPSESYQTIVKCYFIGDHRFQTAKRCGNLYEAHEMVGRNTDQPSKDEKGSFRSVDGQTYDKWLQAVNGCADLVKELVDAPFSTVHHGAIVPLLVVPPGSLWQVDYSDSGAIIEPAREVERATLILRHAWSAQSSHGIITYDLSHLEIVTLPTLHQRVRYLVEAGTVCTPSTSGAT